MKRIIYVTLLSFCMGANAQTPFNTTQYINVNKIAAATCVHGDLFWDPAHSEAACEFPKGSGKHANFMTAVWLSAYDAQNQLHVSAQTYRQNGNDIWPGPLDGNGQLDYATSQLWNKIWKVDRADVLAFAALSSHTIANTPASVLEWPGRANPYAKGYNGNTISVAGGMAPFIDVNNDGAYNPLDGDYPDMKGDQMLWWVFSDNGPTHNNHVTGAAASVPLKIETRALAYAYNRGTVLDNVIYYEYTLVNRSANNYGGFRFALFADIDVGFYSDDYMAFDSTRRMAIGYNARTFDNKYGSSPPITALTILHTPGDAGSVLQPLGSCMYFNNDTSPLGNPTCDTEFNHYMRARFRDGVHLKNDYLGPNVGTTGRGPGPEVNYAFRGDPAVHSEWSACSSNNPPGDVRAVLSTDDYDFNAGSTTQVAFALVIADTSSLNGCPKSGFAGIRQATDTAWANYNYTAPPPNRA